MEDRLQHHKPSRLMREASFGDMIDLEVEVVISVDRRHAGRGVRVEALHQLVTQPADLVVERQFVGNMTLGIQDETYTL